MLSLLCIPRNKISQNFLSDQYALVKLFLVFSSLFSFLVLACFVFSVVCKRQSR